MIFNKNPALIIGAIMAALMLAIGFGLHVSGFQVGLIKDFLEALGVLVGTGVVIRSQVYSPESAQVALNMPPGSSTELLDKVIAADVTVFPGETKAQVAAKVNNAEVQ
jgi:hypothetical protein